VSAVERNIRKVNPRAVILRAESPVTVSDPAAVKGKRVLVIEDGPTLTHGGMSYGAGHVAAQRAGAKEIVDPRPYAKGSIRKVFETYRHVKDVLPAMGYGDKQMAELARTINATPCDLVLIGTPIDLSRLIKINKPSVRVTYELKERGEALYEMVRKTASRLKGRK
ncbi:MAG: GTPase, partial [Elusimicrobiota bacterium]